MSEVLVKGLPDKGKVPAKTHYKDYVDSSRFELSGQPWPECAKWASYGTCENGHEVAKIHLCGKEWCPTCGAKNSWIHQRRIARLLPRAQQMKHIGYWVIQLPKNSRYKLRSKRSLSGFRIRVGRLFKRYGFTRGLDFYHYFGDEGATRGWNPHLNVITDGAYMPPQKLEAFKQYLRRALDEPDLIVHYEYRQSVAEMMHTIRYVTRATFLDKSWDPAMAAELCRFQNGHHWGVWKDEPIWALDSQDTEADSLTRIQKLQSGMCPCCGKPITWSKPIPIVLLQVWGAAEIGGGYYVLPPPHDPPERLDHERLEGLEDWLFGVNTVARNMAESRSDRPRSGGSDMAAAYREYLWRNHDTGFISLAWVDTLLEGCFSNCLTVPSPDLIQRCLFERD